MCEYISFGLNGIITRAKRSAAHVRTEHLCQAHKTFTLDHHYNHNGPPARTFTIFKKFLKGLSACVAVRLNLSRAFNVSVNTFTFERGTKQICQNYAGIKLYQVLCEPRQETIMKEKFKVKKSVNRSFALPVAVCNLLREN